MCVLSTLRGNVDKHSPFDIYIYTYIYIYIYRERVSEWGREGVKGECVCEGERKKNEMFSFRILSVMMIDSEVKLMTKDEMSYSIVLFG